MRFSCGLTATAWYARVEEWSPWFAWYPVKVGNVGGRYVCVWLEWVERRGDIINEWEGPEVRWSYREKVPQ